MLKDTQITRCPAQDIVLNFAVFRIGAPFNHGDIGLFTFNPSTFT
jgi:hypothetical protein